MLGGCSGFSDGRESGKVPLPDVVAEQLERMQPETLCGNVDIASEAARAARAREEAKSKSAEKLPTPDVVDLDAFRARIAAKTQRFSKYMEKSKKQRENA